MPCWRCRSAIGCCGECRAGSAFASLDLKYARDARFAGTTKYPFRKMINLALDGIFSFSTVPLRFVTALGLVTAAMAAAGILYSLVVRIFTPHWVPGWATLILAVLLTGGIEMFCFGILGEYIGRIYTEIKQRPSVCSERDAGAWIASRRIEKAAPGHAYDGAR